MIDNIMQIIAPHHCYGCGHVGTLLCANCKYDITSEQNSACIVCGRPSLAGVCIRCRQSYQKAWYVGQRREVLELLLDAYKFERVKAAHQVFAALLGERLPRVPAETTVVPLPTLPAHIRQRGYDHTLLIARALAKRRGLRLDTGLRRVGKAKQLGATRRERLRQAKMAYEYNGQVDPDMPYLIVDDVFTTGASLHYAAKVLRQAGARQVWVAVVARQPLDNRS